jgi:PAS domain-containing protein
VLGAIERPSTGAHPAEPPPAPPSSLPPGIGPGLTTALAALYAIAALAGRHTAVQGGGVSLVWPAAGVAALWLAARGRGTVPRVDVAVMASLTWVVTVLTGAPATSATVLSLAAVVQAVTFCVLLRRWCPKVWDGGGRVPLTRVDELWRLLLAAALSSLVSAPLVPLASLDDGWSWSLVLVWAVRNTVSILVFGVLAFSQRAWAHERRLARQARADARAVVPVRPVVTGAPGRGGSRRRRPDRLGEHVAAFLLAPAMYALWFVALERLPLAFPLLALTVWVGTRLRTRFVVLHDFVMGAMAIMFTLADIGPFAAVGDQVTQVVVAQLYVGLVSVIGLSLALAGDERDELVADLSAARDSAQGQAALLATIVDTMAEGVTVTSADGSILLRNPRAAQLMGGVVSQSGAIESSAFYGMFRLDGSPVPDAEIPYRQALAGTTVRGVDLLVRNAGLPRGRILSFSSAALPRDAGGGVVTVMHDVTAQREELARAAQVQVSLLPASTPDVRGYEVAARFSPAGSVGGDFYDWQHVWGGLVVTLADVMGKGTGAAILAATTRAVLRAHGAEHDVAATLVAAEDAMAADLAGSGAFVTVFRMRVESATGTVTYADAGHGLTLVVRGDGTSDRLVALGLPLGVVPGEARTSATTHLEPGDAIVTFSDAVLDAIGGSVDDLGQVEAAVRGATDADGAAHAVLTLVTGAGEQLDDLTVVVVRRTATG